MFKLLQKHSAGGGGVYKLRSREETTTETDDRAIAKPERQKQRQLEGRSSSMHNEGFISTCSPRGQDKAQRHQAASGNGQTNEIVSKSPHEINSNSLESRAAEVDCSPHVA